MITISQRLSRYFIVVALLSVGFIALVSNTAITLFFSDYLQKTRSNDDLKAVQYVERLYNDGLTASALMSIMHYAHSESITIRLRDANSNIVWSSGSNNRMMHHDADGRVANDDTLVYRSYSLAPQGYEIGTVDVGRARSVISSLEDKGFLKAVNGILLASFLFSLVIAFFLSSRLSRKFLRPVYLLKENARLIEDGEFGRLNEVKTSTYELQDLALSVKRLAQKLEDQDLIRKRMTSDMAHELRTPLSTLQSHFEAFLDGVWEPDLERLSIVHSEITRLSSLVGELLDLSVIESGGASLNKKVISLSELLQDVVENFDSLFAAKSIRLEVGIRSNVWFLGDEERLKRVVINLLSNAYKYSNEEDEVKISLDRLEGEIRIVIEDSGIGIPARDLPHIFERFYRSDLSRSRGTGGTGIGLTLTKALVEAHGGRIDVESEEGRGTKVVIRFPVK
ncbi:MAG: HAMP domain-containing histidine kinase [Firmicutes bacterium]|nr:HAMP domain-containing histidine kinase [Bacillota bacterium]